MNKHDQLDLFAADLGFVQVFRSQIQDGTVAKMGPIAFTVLQVIKISANYRTGRATISQKRLAEKCGIVEGTVSKAVTRLQELGLLTVETEGKIRKRNTYVVRERLSVTRNDEEQEPVGTLTFPYQPNRLDSIKRDVQSTLRTGEPPAGSPVVFLTIRNLQINAGSGPMLNVDLSNEADTINAQLAQLPPETSAALKRMIGNQLGVDLENDK